MTTKLRLRVAVPWLQDALRSARAGGPVPELPALRWLVGRSGHFGEIPQVWREWLVGGAAGSGADVLRRWPAGPCHARLAGVTTGPGRSWAIAQPVHLAAGLDHLRMSPLEQATPTEAEAREIAESIRAHFDVTRDFELVTFARGAWLLQCPLVDCVTADPSSIVGRNIHDHMPSGAAGARVRSLINEIQMLLHEHPVNQRREREGRLPINALWLWGFGEVPPRASSVASSADVAELRTDDAWLLGLWKSLGRPVSDIDVDAAWTMQRDALIAVSVPPSLNSATALEMLDRGLLLELRQGMRSGRLMELSLLLGQFEVRLDSCSRWRFWRKPASLEELST